MARTIHTLCAAALALAMSALPSAKAQAQPSPVKRAFSSTLQCRDAIPSYTEGAKVYHNLVPGGQWGGYVPVAEAPGRLRVWSNSDSTWASQSIDSCATMFFIDPGVLFIGMADRRCALLSGEPLEEFLLGASFEGRLQFYGDYRFWGRPGRIRLLVLGMGGRWGVVDPSLRMKVPFRHSTVEEAVASLEERRKHEKPADMGEVEFLFQTLIQWAGDKDACLHMDWNHYDPSSGSLFYTLRELSFAGPYMMPVGSPYDGRYDIDPTGDTQFVLLDSCLGVVDGIVSFIPSPDTFQGKMVPLCEEILGVLEKGPYPLDSPFSPSPWREDDVFYGYPLGRYGNWRGIVVHKDGSFLAGHFSGDIVEGPGGVQRARMVYHGAFSSWDFTAFQRAYFVSERNAGRTPSGKDMLEAYRSNIPQARGDDSFAARGYNKDTRTLELHFNPGCEVSIPVDPKTGARFMEIYDEEGWSGFTTGFRRVVRDDGSVYIDDILISTLDGLEIEYKADSARK